MGRMADVEERATRRRPGAERLLETASDLFYREGIRAVGVDTVSERAGVSKRTLYNRFGGKDGLVAEYLRRRDEGWKAYLRGATEAVVEPKEKLLAVFEAYEEWLVGEDFRGCAFANAAAEIPDPDHPARVVARRHKEGIEEHLAALAKEAGFDESEDPRKAAAPVARGCRRDGGDAPQPRAHRSGEISRAGAARRPTALRSRLPVPRGRKAPVPGRRNGERSDQPRWSPEPRVSIALRRFCRSWLRAGVAPFWLGFLQ